MLSSLGSCHILQPVSNVTINLLVYFWSGLPHDRCNTCIYLCCVLYGGLIAACLLSSWIDPLGPISLVDSDVTIVLCCWFWHYGRTSWPSQLYFWHYGWLLFHHDLCCQTYGGTSILSRILLPTLSSDFYYIATCKTLDQSLSGQ